MGKSNRDGSTEESRPARHQQARPQAGDGPVYVRPNTPHPTTYTLNGSSYFPHPCGYHGKSSDDRCQKSDGGRRRMRPMSSSKSDGQEEDPPISLISSLGNNTSINAELKVSLAAKHLASQISESKKYWVTFQKKFEEEIAKFKYYADDNVLQRIWQKRIEYHGKYKNGENQDDEEFNIQRMKLEACLDQVNEAAEAFVRSRPPNDHDPRHLALDKIRGAGTLVVGLAAKSALSSASCASLVTEASNLEKLVNPKSSDANVLHRFDKRKTKGSTSDDGNEGANSTEPAIMEVHDLLLNDTGRNGEAAWG
ncbi:hypothetical protein F4804DRAFT_332150 [Jackrogersella minutella]|nr:hypothetical protein F4804DRAFT_332150 [Jackrogersella minutella]